MIVLLRSFYLSLGLMAAGIAAAMPVSAAPEIRPALLEAGFSAEPFVQTVAAQLPAPARAASGRMIRAGLSTHGAPIQLMAKGEMTITDAAQPGRRLAVKAGEIATFTYGANAQVAARGVTYSGPI